MVNKNVLYKKMEFIREHLLRVEFYAKCTYKEFVFDRNAQDIVEFNLFQSINLMIAMMEHIVVDEDYGLPQTAYHAAEILVSKKILTENDADIMRKMVGFRNVIAHQYDDIDKKKVYDALTKGVKDIRRIVNKLANRFKL